MQNNILDSIYLQLCPICFSAAPENTLLHANLLEQCSFMMYFHSRLTFAEEKPKPQ